MRAYERYASLAIRIAVCAALLAAVPAQALARGSYNGYTYTNSDRTAASLNGYIYQDSFDGIGAASGPFNDIEDLFVAPDDTIYIVDSGNNRIVHMDRGHNVIGFIGDGEGESKLSGPKGVYVTGNGTVYVADTKNNRIAVFDASGAFVNQFGKPDSPLLSKDFIFLPAKIVVDKRDYMFIVCDGMTQGLVQLKPGGDFDGFFGANHVPFSLTRLLTKLIATEEQKAQMAAEKPPEFSNLYQDKEGFIYTTTLGIRREQIKRLSAVGVDTLNTQETASGRYGDLRMKNIGGRAQYEAFFDVAVDAQGFITGLDQTTGRAFQYDSLGNLLFSFGGIGTQDGLFITPSSIAQTSDGSIYISDKTNNRIDRFKITEFGKLVHQASILYNEGRYEESEGPWKEALRLNSNYDLAYLAIGKSLYKREKYKEAMEYFELARARKEHAKAFLEYRKIYVRQHFEWFAGGAVAILILLKLADVWNRRRNKAKQLLRYGIAAKGGKGQ